MTYIVYNAIVRDLVRQYERPTFLNGITKHAQMIHKKYLPAIILSHVQLRSRFLFFCFLLYKYISVRNFAVLYNVAVVVLCY